MTMSMRCYDMRALPLCIIAKRTMPLNRDKTFGGIGETPQIMPLSACQNRLTTEASMPKAPCIISVVLTPITVVVPQPSATYILTIVPFDQR